MKSPHGLCSVADVVDSGKRVKLMCSVWENVEEPQIEDQRLSAFETLFSRQVVQPIEIKKKVHNPAKVAKILDPKRSQNVAILITSHHIEGSDVENALYSFDTPDMSLDLLRQIALCRGSKEEVEAIEAHVLGNPDLPLDKAEQFLWELSRIPHLAERIDCIIAQTTFHERIAALEGQLNNLKDVSDELCTKESVKRVLGLILALGNYMNGGNHMRGQADGFGLGILPKLKDVKSNADPSMTLLNFVVSSYIDV
ncbi:unnamed protein product, partial [Darwinula stevensoni]